VNSKKNRVNIANIPDDPLKAGSLHQERSFGLHCAVGHIQREEGRNNKFIPTLHIWIRLLSGQQFHCGGSSHLAGANLAVATDEPQESTRKRGYVFQSVMHNLLVESIKTDIFGNFRKALPG